MWNLIFYSYKKTIGYREIMRHYFSTIGLTPTVKSKDNVNNKCSELKKPTYPLFEVHTSNG